MASYHYNPICCSCDCSCHTNMTSIWTLSPDEPVYMNATVLGTKFNSILDRNHKAPFTSNTYENFTELMFYEYPFVCVSSEGSAGSLERTSCDYSASCSCCLANPASPLPITELAAVSKEIGNAVSAFLLSPVRGLAEPRCVDDCTFIESETSTCQLSDSLPQLCSESSSVTPLYSADMAITMSDSVITRSPLNLDLEFSVKPTRMCCRVKPKMAHLRTKTVKSRLKDFAKRLKSKLSLKKREAR